MEQTKVIPGYGLTETDIEDLLKASLKPDEISGDAEIQHNRIDELVSWFVRFTHGHANPKWLAAHACELAYYIATTDAARHLNLRDIRMKAFEEGVYLPDDKRELLLMIKQNKNKIPT